jgi:hypothetical protein
MGNQPETSGGPVTSHLIVADPQKLTIETFAQYQCSTCSMNPIETFMLGEIPAKHTIIGGFRSLRNGMVLYGTQWRSHWILHS